MNGADRYKKEQDLIFQALEERDLIQRQKDELVRRESEREAAALAAEIESRAAIQDWINSQSPSRFQFQRPARRISERIRALAVFGAITKEPR